MGKHAKRRKRSLVVASAATAIVTAVGVPLLTASAAHASGVTGSADTTDMSGARVNGNIYDNKTDVYLDGGSNAPAAQHLAVGDYFFAVLDPGGQNDPNDGSAGNLSVDAAGARSFTANADGSVSPILHESTHTFVPSDGGGTVQLADYNDTSNPGGEYIVAVCTFVSDGNGGAQTVDPKDCKYDAFKVRASVICTADCGGTTIPAPTGSKTATPVHDRTVNWSIEKSADQTSFSQLTPATAHYTVTVTKTLSESWGISGTISVFNTYINPLPITVSDNGVEDVSNSGNSVASLCTVTPPADDGTAQQFADGTASGTVNSGDATTPGEEDFAYSCILADPGADTYRNTAQIGYTDGMNQPQLVPVTSGNFDFSNVTELGDPESVLVTDTYTDTGSPSDAAHPNGTTVSDSTTWKYDHTFFNHNCQTYTNTATVSALVGDQVLTDPPDLPATSQVTVTFCGPNNGGLTMGWWQNKNGQNLLKAASTACSTLNGYLAGGYTTPTDLINVSSKSTGQYATASCTPTYLATFTSKVISAANASGSGTPMELGQWLTTVLDTATYANQGAGVPTLNSAQTVTNPASLFGLGSCTSIDSLLRHAVTGFSSYKGTKSTVTALITEFNNINNNQQQTC